MGRSEKQEKVKSRFQIGGGERGRYSWYGWSSDDVLHTDNGRVAIFVIT